MTSEVALLNRTAVALAADSAATVTYWQDGSPQTRFFKGANKIFHISRAHPVGVMTYAAANLQGVPWEVIIKAYRDQRGDKAHDTLEGYAADFFDLITADTHLYPQDYQERQLVSRTIDAAMRIYMVAINDAKVKAEKKQDKKKPLMLAVFKRLKGKIEGEELVGGIDAAFVADNFKKFKDEIKKSLQEVAVYKDVEAVFDIDDLLDLAFKAVFKKGWTTLQSTGLVFAGYGARDYFPRLLNYMCYGVLVGKLVCNHLKDEDAQISHENVAEIKPLAQSDMVKTFMYGTSISALVEIDDLFIKALDEFAEKLAKAGLLSAGADIETQKEEAKQTFTNGTSAYLSNAHTRPLRNVVGMLSVDELAELAETLISIESLKERVTRPTESVSGPIDVAVISKSDGFIWIKRKHYFDPTLNPRYMARIGV